MSLTPAFHESLPYIDPEPNADALAAARALIAAEQASSSPKPLAEPAREPSFTPVLQTELDRLAAAGSGPAPPQQPLDLSRYEAQEPPSQGSSPSALRAVLESAYVSHAYLDARTQNLELLDRWGKNAWLVGNYHLEAELRALEAELAVVKREMDVVNHDRKRRQDAVKAEMLTLDDNWRKGVGRVLETEIAVEELRARIREELRSKAAQNVQ
jgi:pre-mRNA-splicing factor SPF27